MQLTLRNYSKNYGTHNVLEIPELIFKGGLYWIKGENGSGKSSLFKSIAGLIPYTGEVFLNETINLTTNPVEFRKYVNYSEAEPLFPSFLTANDLIRFVGKAKNSSQEQQAQIIQSLGINNFLHQSCGTFSSGMLKKLSLAMAFLGEPKVLILDEPLITLDETSRNQLLNMIEKMLEREVVILVSSHQHFQIDKKYISQGFEIRNKMLIPL